MRKEESMCLSHTTFLLQILSHKFQVDYTFNLDDVEASKETITIQLFLNVNKQYFWLTHDVAKAMLVNNTAIFTIKTTFD